MEITKMYGIIEELINEEKESNIQTILNNILGVINSGDGTQVDEFLNKLFSWCQGSIVNEYPFSKQKILKKLNSENLFGNALYDNVKNMLETESYKLKENLSKLISNRNSQITILKQNFEQLQKLDIESYYENLEEFEIGLIIPNSENELEKVNFYLKDWDFILKHITELLGEENIKPRVSSVDTGSILVYVVGSYMVTKAILHIVKEVLDIYKKVLEIKELKDNAKKLGFKTTEKEGNKKIKDLLKSEKERLVKLIVKEYAKKNGNTRDAELENAILQSVGKIIKMHDKGILIEANSPKETEDNDDEESENTKTKTERNKKLQNIKVVSEIVSNISTSVKTLTGLGEETLQLTSFDEESKEEEGEDK
ncbi:MAG: hypothetical protein PF569_02180 [Candidatus Woesearchaeota archaeon]|jgi:primosomal protein N'|nr:hypothetical protein [Candidatus Woesearchaeota archaeon]